MSFTPHTWQERSKLCCRSARYPQHRAIGSVYLDPAEVSNTELCSHL